jgi:2'-5' RNA ligase
MSGAPPSARLFIALWPDADTRAALAAWRDRWSWPPGAAVVPDERLHLTLHFIGPTPRARLPDIERGLDVAWAPFELMRGAATVWPRGLALWAPEPWPAPAADLHATLGEALGRLGLPVDERPFHPHVTLARKARGAVPPPEPPALRWAVRDVALAESDRGYRVLARFQAP